MSANKSESGRLPPAENMPYSDAPENEAIPGLGRQASYLKHNRMANGGIEDDPTDSGEPVRNRKSFSNLTGGR